MAQDSMVLNELVKAKENIKRKFHELKTGEADVHSLVTQTFKPIIEPLQKISKVTPAPVPELAPEPLTDNNYLEIDNWLQSTNRDKLYGPKKFKNGTIKLGDSEIDFTPSSVLVDKTSYQLSPGLIHLIFSKQPKKYTDQDLQAYKEILTQTSAHLNADGVSVKTGGKKYKDVIKKLFPLGRGLSVSLQKHNYIYWNDVNELIDRLKLLLASQQAGNTGVSNEILSIYEELLEAGVIKRMPDNV